jgi:hypothetical protein
MLKRKTLSAIIILTGFLIMATLLLEYCKPADQKSAEGNLTQTGATYVGEKSCQSCHAKEFAF